MVGLAWLCNFLLGFMWLAESPMQLSVARSLGLSGTQIAVWFNMPLIMFSICSIPAGMVADRFKIKSVLGTGLVLLTVFGLARGLAMSYAVLLLVTGIYAFGQVLIFVCLPKIIGEWCAAEEIGLASGLYLSAFSVGSAVALAVTQPLFGDDWRKCFTVLSTTGIVVTTMWWSIAAQSPPVALNSSLDQVGFRSFVCLLKIRNLILLTVIYFFYIAAWSGWITFAYPYFVIARHFAPSLAGYVLTVTMLGYILGSILIPFSSDRIGLRRPFSIGGCLILIIGFSLLSFFPEVVGARSLSLALGLSFGALVTFIFSIPLELSEIEDKLLGSATGIIASGGSLASLLITPLLGVHIGRLHEAHPQDYVSVWVTISIVSMLLLTCFLLLKETGTRARATQLGGTVQNNAPGTLAGGVSPEGC